MASPEYVLVGRIRKPHGIRGEVVVELVTNAPGAIFASGRRLFAGTHDGLPLREGRDAEAAVRTLTVAQSRDQGESWFVRFDGVADRSDAERWRDRTLLLPFEELVALAPAGDDEVYYHDLVGMTALLEDDTPLGRVTAIYELPQGLLLEVSRPGASSALIPYQPAVVLGVDLDARTVRVRPPDGLLD